MANKQHSLEIFEESIKSKATLRTYKVLLQKFMDFAKVRDHDSFIRLGTKTIEALVQDYIIHLKRRYDKGEISANSFPTLLAPIELFLVQNDIIINSKKLNKMFPERSKVSGSLPYTNGDIKKMLELASPRLKLVIHFLASTGCRIGALDGLKFKHLSELSDGCMSVLVYEGSREEYHTFLTPEAVKVLKQYLDKRQKSGEKINLESPLIRNSFRDGMAWFKVRPVSSETIKQQMKKLVRQAGVRSKLEHGKRRYDKMIDHAFRKRFNTVLKLNKEINPNFVEKMMGHKRGNDGSYFQPTVNELFEEFKKAIPDLTIDESDKLRLQNQAKEETIKKLESEKDKEIAQLKADMRTVFKLLQQSAKEQDKKNQK